VDARTVAWLAGPEGRAVLGSLPPYAEDQALAVAEGLRRTGLGADVVAAVMTQSRLRGRAVTKLGPASQRMLFTADGLEQASRAAVARRHAGRFADAGTQRVWDLGCGIGVDTAALAERGLEVTAVESDPVTAAVAAANLADHDRVRVLHSRAEDVVLPNPPAEDAGAWLDPARRVPGVADARGRTRRVFRLGEVSPSWDYVRSVAARLPAVGAKLGPGFPHAEVPDGAQAEWLSYGGEALECTVWWGDLVDRPGRSAVVHDGARWHTLSAPVADRPETAGTVTAGDYVYDPDRAVLAAGLVPAVCGVVGGGECAPGAGYVVSDRRVLTPWARCLQVREVLPLQVKVLRQWARSNDIGPLTVKKRGGWVDAGELRRGVRPRGSQEATLVLVRVSSRGRTADPAGTALWVTPCAGGST
jgi:SAM-dependent methyltransferase